MPLSASSGSRGPSTSVLAPSGEDNPAETAPPSDSAEVEFWKTIKDSTDPHGFAAYLKKFPKGTFVALARKRLTALQGAQREKLDALFYAGNFKEAADGYRQAAEQGDAWAQTRLGELYLAGLGSASFESFAGASVEFSSAFR